MRKILVASILLALLSPVYAVVSYSDKALLAVDTTFQNRVKESLVSACVSIANEGFNIPHHKKRADFCSTILFAPDTYKILFAATVATDANVVGDATQAGTVALTAGNTAAQAALVTDGHIDTAISGEFNAFLQLP